MEICRSTKKGIWKLLSPNHGQEDFSKICLIFNILHKKISEGTEDKSFLFSNRLSVAEQVVEQGINPVLD